MMHTAWKRMSILVGGSRGRRGLLIAMIGLSVGLLLWGILFNWQALQSYDWQLDWTSLALSALAYALSLACVVLGWTVLMRTLQAKSTWQQDIRFFFYSWLARRLPTAAPYMVSRVMLYEEIGVPKRVTSIALLWENVLLIASAALSALILLPFTPAVQDQFLQLPLLAAAAACLLLVVMPSLLGRVVNRILGWLNKEPLPLLVKQSATSLALVIYSVSWLMGGGILFFLIRAMHPLAWTDFPLVLQSWLISGLVSFIVFLLPFGFGLRDVTLAYLLSFVIPLPIAIVVTLFMRLWVMINELFWVLVAVKV